MSLGEKIFTYRTKMNLSQGDLAEMLDVSRQSISKWETNTSIPDLDKIIKLSEIFQITIDELVKENYSEQTFVEEQYSKTEERKSNTTKVIGTILLCFGFLIVLLLSLMGGILAGLIFGSPFLACGTICLVCKRNIGLWCSWTWYILVDLYLRYATGISYNMIRMTLYFEPSMNYLRLITAWIMFLLLVALIIATVRRFRNEPIELSKKNLRLIIWGWIGLLLFIVLRDTTISIIVKEASKPATVVPSTSGGMEANFVVNNMFSFVNSIWYQIIVSITDWIKLIWFTSLSSVSVRYYKGWKTTKID